MLQRFAADVEPLRQRLGELLSRGQRDDLRRELHSIKGLAAMLGAKALSETAAQG